LTESQSSKKQVFIRRVEGMPFEEFKNACIQAFKEAGLLSEETVDANFLPDEGQIRLHNLNEEWAKEEFGDRYNPAPSPQSESTTQKPPEKS